MAVNSFSVESRQQSINTGADVSTSTSDALLHELQLGEQLNQSISQTRRADFTLMLAMLAQDVREHSQFVLPVDDSTKSAVIDNAKLRRFFDLPEQAPLALRDNEEILTFNQANLLSENRLESLHLSNALSPKPLAFRDNINHIPTHIMTNTTLYCQLKHSQISTEIASVNSDNTPYRKENSFNAQLLNKSLSFNAKEWLKGIEESLVKSPLVA